MILQTDLKLTCQKQPSEKARSTLNFLGNTRQKYYLLCSKLISKLQINFEGREPKTDVRSLSFLHFPSAEIKIRKWPGKRQYNCEIHWRQTHRGTQFGEVLSTSQVANNFIENGFWGVEDAETSRRTAASAMLSRFLFELRTLFWWSTLAHWLEASGDLTNCQSQLITR